MASFGFTWAGVGEKCRAVRVFSAYVAMADRIVSARCRVESSWAVMHVCYVVMFVMFLCSSCVRE
jgi:hypothetical protein